MTHSNTTVTPTASESVVYGGERYSAGAVRRVQTATVRSRYPRRRQSKPARRIYWVWTVALVFALLAAGTAVARRGNGSALDRALNQAHIPTTITVEVQPGDTLWSLARRYGNPKRDIQERVYRIRTENGFASGAGLHPGQRLLVPVENPVELAKLRFASEQTLARTN
ncbi:MAG: hypothetical protein OHK0029_40850 [Armatimonadaceae bacterium]